MMPSRLLLVLLLALPAPLARAQHRAAPPADAQTVLARLSGGLTFAENRGQWPSEVLFRARTGGATAWVTRDGVTFDFYEVERPERDAEGPWRGNEPEATRRGHVVRMRFEGARARHTVGHGRQAAYHSYFLGGDPSRWTSRIALYDEVVLEDLYPGIDLRLYGDEGLLRYDLALAPGADLQQVRMRLEGVGGVALTEAGALQMQTALGPVEHRGLLAYQDGARGREPVASTFVVAADGAVAFDVRGADPRRALVIDPLVWSTFLGGGSGDHASAVAVEADGMVVVSGRTQSAGFPTTLGAYDASHNGSTDAFVARLSADGAALLWATFLGGTEGEDAPGLAVSAEGAVTLSGQTSSTDFPATPGAYDTSFNGGGLSPADAFVARLSADGAALLWATYLGGGGSDGSEAAAVGPDGSVTVVGDTGSNNFPTTPGAFDATRNGRDAFVSRLSADGSSLLYSTFLGGNSSDYAYGVGLRTDGGAVVAGYTESGNFPTTPGAFDTALNGITDAFVVRLSADGSALHYGTFLGGGGGEYTEGVAVGADGSATVAGHTWGNGFPATPGAFDTTYNGGFVDAFVARLSADGDALLWATFLGASAEDFGLGVALGADESAIVVGETWSAGFPTTPDAFDTTFNGGLFNPTDAFVSRLSADGAALLYSTFLGGGGDEYAEGVAVSADGTAAAVGSTYGGAFPTTPGAYDTTPNGDDDAFVSLLDVGAPASDALVSHYPLDGDAADASGNGHHGAVAGATPTLDRFGDVGGALAFDGIDDHVQTAASNFLDGQQAGTLAFWVRLDTYASGSVAFFDYSTDGSFNSFYRLRTPFSGSQPRLVAWYKYGGQGLAPSLVAQPPLSTGRWYHAALVADGTSQVRFYLDGQEVPVSFNAEGTHADGSEWFADINGVSSYDHFLVMGASKREGDPFASFLDGALDDVRLYDRALSSAEVFALCDEGDWACGQGLTDLSVTVTPADPPVVLPAAGGDLQYTVTIRNNTAQPQSLQGWADARLPSGNDRSPVLGPLNVTLPPGGTLSRTLVQRVPPSAPAGRYVYNVKLGAYPQGLSGLDSFSFEKSASEAPGRRLEGGEWMVVLAETGEAVAAGDAWAGDAADGTAAASSLPDAVVLSPAQPNPLQTQATLRYGLPAPAHVRLVVYDVLGREVAVVVDAEREAGWHAEHFDASHLAAGAYLYTLEAGSFHAARRMTVLR